MGQIVVKKNIGGIEGSCVITPAIHGDNRGYFMETYSQRDMAEAGLNIPFVQDNQSMSTNGVLRGLHFQKQFPQTKLVRAIKGSVFDVAVGFRAGSATYGKWYGVELTDTAELCYKCDDFYHANDEGGLAWNDPEIGIIWLQLVGEHQGSAFAEGYTLEDGTSLNLRLKDQKWSVLRGTFKF
ncbi:MAG: dTDP-4-dehydrorhamnose 3,5-epimerase [Lachnospiraceae bacterium]|nr:dTDP-4-dehydrorhamnose 3,5-epimerase [Lachnospiraceae bacterium]